MRNSFRRLLIIVFSIAVASLKGYSQTYTMGREYAISWETFANEFLEEMASDEDELVEAVQDELERLQTLTASPININVATRDQLRNISFLSDEQADSIISKRQRLKYFASLGELMSVYGLNAQTRRWLSLFMFAGDTVAAPRSALARLLPVKGDAAVYGTLPLYRRAGGKSSAGNNRYLGHAPSHTVRANFRSGDALSAGFRLQQQSYEPFASYGNHPYDFVTLYVQYSPQRSPFKLIVGDFRASSGQGLVLGRSYVGSRFQLLKSRTLPRFLLSGHTSASESDYLRGAAAMFSKRHLDLAVFASYKKLDARLSNDTVTSLITTGYHRNLSELSTRHNLANTTIGVRASARFSHFCIGLTSVADTYDHVLWPQARAYNRYYLHGKEAFVNSVDYSFGGKRLQLSGELAADKKAHLSWSQTVRFDVSRYSTWVIATRWFSKRYVAPHASTLQSTSRARNERSVMLGWNGTIERFDISAYADYRYSPAPLYRATLGSSRAVDSGVELATSLGKGRFVARWRLKAQEYDVTVTNLKFMQWVRTQRLSLSWNDVPVSVFNMSIAANGVFVSPQVGKDALGGMLSTRLAWQDPKHRFRTNVFVAYFHTKDYSSRLYVYEPNLTYMHSLPSFAYHGFRFAAQAQLALGWRLSLGLRAAYMKYFDRSTIGTSLQKIDSSMQSELSGQVIFKF